MSLKRCTGRVLVPMLMGAFFTVFTQGAAYAQSYTPLHPPDSQFTKYAYCYEVGTGRRVPYCTLIVATGAYNSTNGHFHNTNRPKSGLSASGGGYYSNNPISVTTGPDGGAMVYLRSTAVGQAEYVQACAAVCDTH